MSMKVLVHDQEKEKPTFESTISVTKKKRNHILNTICMLLSPDSPKLDSLWYLKKVEKDRLRQNSGRFYLL